MLYGCRAETTENIQTGLTEREANDWLEGLEEYHYIPSNGYALIGKTIAKDRAEDRNWISYNCKYNKSAGNEYNLSCTPNDSGAYEYSKKKSGSTYTLVQTYCSTWNNMYRLSKSLGEGTTYIRCSWSKSFTGMKNPCGEHGDI